MAQLASSHEGFMSGLLKKKLLRLLPSLADRHTTDWLLWVTGDEGGLLSFVDVVRFFFKKNFVSSEISRGMIVEKG